MNERYYGRVIRDQRGNIPTHDEAMKDMVRAFAKGDVATAQKLHAKYYPVFKDLFIETNPVPTKAALAMLGLMEEEVRLPLVKMAEANRARLVKTLKGCGILK